MAEGMKREFSATARNLRMSARKARLVMDAVRGRGADEAMVMLQFVNRRAAPAIRKLIQSAVANAEEYGNRSGIDIETDSLVVAEARVDEGPRMKRWRPRSRGMANPFTRYTCHLHVTLAEPEYLEEKSKGKPAWRKRRQRLSREQRLIKVGRMEAPAESKAEKPAASEKAAAPKAEKKADAEAKAEKKPAKKAEKKPAKKAAAKAEKKPAKKAEKKTETKSAKKSDKKK
ncbi:MAG: 50S ribosomal protein L22 [Planctomycetes bacterium]|nr:50S ribosomal protein L22 [Planctomycetota bacterium]